MFVELCPLHGREGGEESVQPLQLTPPSSAHLRVEQKRDGLLRELQRVRGPQQLRGDGRLLQDGPDAVDGGQQLVAQNGRIQVHQRDDGGAGGGERVIGLAKVLADDGGGGGAETVEEEGALAEMVLHLVEARHPGEGEVWG